MKHASCFLLALMVLCKALAEPAAPAEPAPKKDIHEDNRRLGRGMNLGNALEAPREGEWGLTLEEDFFERVQKAGFRSVRIPIRWSAHTSATASALDDDGALDGLLLTAHPLVQRCGGMKARVAHPTKRLSMEVPWLPQSGPVISPSG